MAEALEITRARIIFMVAGIAVIVSQPGGWDLPVAIGLAFALACAYVIPHSLSYMRKDPALRFSRPTTMAISLVLWSMLFGVAFFFLYYPESIWRWS